MPVTAGDGLTRGEGGLRVVSPPRPPPSPRPGLPGPVGLGAFPGTGSTAPAQAPELPRLLTGQPRFLLVKKENY